MFVDQHLALKESAIFGSTTARHNSASLCISKPASEQDRISDFRPPVFTQAANKSSNLFSLRKSQMIEIQCAINGHTIVGC